MTAHYEVNNHCGCGLCLALLKPDSDEDIKEMEKITHVFKEGDWVDCSELSNDQVRAILSKAFNDGINGYADEHDKDKRYINFVVNHSNKTYFSNGVYIKSMEEMHGIKPNKLTWDDITKPIETETPWFPEINETCFVSLLDEHNWVKGCVTGALGELIYFETERGIEVLRRKKLKFKPLTSEDFTPVNEVTDKSYKPKAGEIFEVDMGDYLAKALYIGIDYKGRHTYQFVEGDIEGKVYYDKNTDLFYPIKSEREKPTPVNEVTDNTYIPKVGEECEVLLDGSWRESYIVGVDNEGFYVFQCLDYPQGDLYDSFDDLKYYRPIKTEGEKLVDLALEQLTAHFMAYMSDQDESTVAAMVELGWRPAK